MAKRTVSTPIGALTLVQEGVRLSALLFDARARFADETPLLLCAEKELLSYFAGELFSFSVPLEFCGTPFEVAVWRALCRVPYGETITYGSLATLAGYPGAARAVGNAMKKNPIPVFVPCHRVVSACGIGNYAWGIERKETLMRLEGSL